MSHAPTVSVCIPTYNGAAFLRPCLDSVLSQSWRDIEVLVVDDVSSDDTLSIAESYSRRDHRISIFRNERNLGLVSNWNRCLTLARGEWIKFVFQDDALAPTCLERMIESAGNAHQLIFCGRDLIFEESVDHETRQSLRITPSLHQLFPRERNVSPERIRDTTLKETRNFFGEPTASLLHRSLIERFGGFNPHLAQLSDLEYWIRVASNVGLRYIPDSLASFRVHASSTSALNRASHLFRSRELDRLVLLHEFAYNAHFAGMRRTAKKLQPPRNFPLELAKRALWLEKVAIIAANDTTAPDPRPLEEWKKLVAAYPRLKHSGWHVPLRIGEWLDRHLMWRLR